MPHDLDHIRSLADRLRPNLAACARDPAVDPVHDTRTGTRRLQATLEGLLREISPGDAGSSIRNAASALLRQLKKIRRAAAPVRDLDVHRKLLEKFAERPQQPILAAARAEGLPSVSSPANSPSNTLASALHRQAADLDAWLRQRREACAHELQAAAPSLLAKFDKRRADLEDALRHHRKRARRKPPAVVALDTFARLASEMQHLDASNLHDFRKGAKKARYVAELAAQGDAEAAQVGATLRKLQDEIGDWHDWLVLADEARTALGDNGAELIARLASQREKHFVAAMKTAAKLRGRLMGEWLAVTRTPAARPATRSPVSPASHPPRRPVRRVATTPPPQAAAG